MPDACHRPQPRKEFEIMPHSHHLLHRAAPFIVLLVLFAIVGWSTSGVSTASGKVLERQVLELAPPIDISAPADEDSSANHSFDHIVASGETLSTIFDDYDLGQTVLYAILSADEELLALDTLRPGTRLHFVLDDESQRLQQLDLHLHPGRTVHYRRTSSGIFEFEDEISPTIWYQRIVSGPIRGSFYLSALRAGLDKADIVAIQKILQDKINFNRDVRADDRFEVVMGIEMSDEGATGNIRVEGVRLLLRNRVVSAFMHKDGNYYDPNGESLLRAFLRYPTQRHYRISSPFNPNRHHPVTGRRAPHNGTDFATPSGTPVMATGEGVVTRVRNHPYAGKYIEIKHTGQYKTRYLHLSRILVRKGQHVDRGQRIAFSGNTGRTTGPHLHYELHINNRPVNAMTADIPTATHIPQAEMASFKQRMEVLRTVMISTEAHLATSHESNQDKDS